MKTLLIQRHAKSSWDQAELEDHERPLSKRGLRDAPLMGKILLENNLIPDLILSSTARRAQDTAVLIIEASGYKGKLLLDTSLYASGPSAFIAALSCVADKHNTVMVVGHNPGLEELLSQMTGQVEPLPTAALAQVNLPIQKWGELSNETKGQVVKIFRPKEI
jgi:phosphohistidine phosphatase